MHDLADLAIAGQGMGILEDGGCRRTAVAPVPNLEHRTPLSKACALFVVRLTTVAEPIQSLRLREICHTRASSGILEAVKHR